MSQSQKPDLTIVILSYNVKELLLNCLKSIYDSKPSTHNWQVIVVDNKSADNSLEAAKHKYPKIEALQTNQNLGFSRGNNYAVKYIKSDFVLFLNPDTKVVGDAITKSLEFIKTDPQIGALSCRVELPDGRLDYSCHRGFPTPWNSISYFLGLSRLFPKSKIFSGYTATYLDIKKTHEIDCGNGSFMLLPILVGEKVGWWDIDYFWNGEDIEFFYRIKEAGFKVYYFAEAKIIHYKGSSSGLWKTAKTAVSKETRIKSAKYGIQAMRIFYLKHYYPKYPPILREFVLLGIKFLETIRLAKISFNI